MAILEHGLLLTTKSFALGMVYGVIAQTTGEGAIPFGNTAFWSFVATAAFIFQIFVQRYYAIRAAHKTQEVADDLASTTRINDGKMRDIKETGDKIHTLVNNAMGLVLKENLRLAMRIAEITGLEADRLLVEEAKHAYDVHDEKQRQVDEMERKSLEQRQ